MTRPNSGTMVFWRFKAKIPCGWQFGYVTYESNGLIRLGTYNRDKYGGVVVEPNEIEWKPHDQY